MFSHLSPKGAILEPRVEAPRYGYGLGTLLNSYSLTPNGKSMPLAAPKGHTPRNCDIPILLKEAPNPREEGAETMTKACAYFLVIHTILFHKRQLPSILVSASFHGSWRNLF